jgi:hypothetical protein
LPARTLTRADVCTGVQPGSLPLFFLPWCQNGAGAKRIQTGRAGLDDPSRPIGVIMLPRTGRVDETETALGLVTIRYCLLSDELLGKIVKLHQPHQEKGRGALQVPFEYSETTSSSSSSHAAPRASLEGG